MRQEKARKLSNLTRTSYDMFAGEFSASRAGFWPELAYLAEHALPRGRVLDIGCGNGRLFPLLATREVEYTGIDNSAGLLSLARKLHPEATFMEGDATALPFPDCSFDTAFSFAVLHHIPSAEMRRAFIREAARVLRPNGTLVLSVWDLWSTKNILPLLKGTLVHDRGDLMLTFGRDKLPRYLHAFTMRELRSLLSKNGFSVIGAEVARRPSGQGNYVVIAKKRGD